MTRRRRGADLPGTRRVVIADATPQPLAIIAGLPAAASQAALRALEAEFPLWKIVTEDFPKSFEKTYQFDPPLLNLLRSTCSFAAAQPVLPIPRPAQVMLFYVDAPNSQRLLDAFGYSVLASRLKADDWHWPQGRHWRIDINVTVDILLNAARQMRQGPLEELRLRLEQPTKDDPLFLPPRNFKHRVEGNLVARFNRLLHMGEFAEVAFDDLATQRFDYDNLEGFFKNMPGTSANFRVDARGLVFATSSRGQDGNRWAEDITGLPIGGFRNMLEGLYRFGTALRGGFQYDVQWSGKRPLQDEKFYDAESGQDVRITDSHANIFANDNVR